MVYGIYNLLLALILVLGLPLLPLLFLLGRRFREGFLQRMGFYPAAVRRSLSGHRPIWIHAVSVGEVLSAGRLAQRLKESFPKRKILLSTTTATGKKISRQAVTQADGIIFFPLDHPWIVRRALSAFDPSVIIFLETEIWPNFLRASRRRGIPALLISGRLSPRAFRQYRLFRRFFSQVVRQFTAVGMQSQENAERMIRLGVPPQKVWVTGSLKHATGEGKGVQDRETAETVIDLRGGGNRQVLVAGSTHQGEEEILLDVFQFLKSRFPNLLMVLAPRHPQRFYEVERLLQKRSVRYERKSLMNGQDLPDVIFLDTLGELPTLYAVADVAFVGGSLVDAGGHNLIEPARLRKPILFGPYMTNFADLAEEMKRAGGGVEVKGKEDLTRAISALLADRAKAERMGELAYGVVEGDRGVIERSLNLISRYLEP